MGGQIDVEAPLPSDPLQVSGLRKKIEVGWGRGDPVYLGAAKAAGRCLLCGGALSREKKNFLRVLPRAEVPGARSTGTGVSVGY